MTVETLHSDVTVLRHGLNRATWGDDAARYWMRMSGEVGQRTEHSVWLTGADAVEYAFKHPEIFSSRPAAAFYGSDTGLIPLQIDPPDHRRYRRILDPLFSPKRMGALRDQITDLANWCIDAFDERDSCDFSREFALPYTSGVFLSLLGLSLDGLEGFIVLKENLIRPVADNEEEANKIRTQAGGELRELFSSELDSRKMEPKDDLLSHFVDLEGGGELDREETLNICHLLFIAGLDTVSGTLECMFADLARHDELRQQVVDDPDVIPTAVEEFLRWIVTSPIAPRVALEDVEIDGFEIRKGEVVYLVHSTPGFSPDRVEHPERIDLQRDNNQHAAFGLGVHRCLGSHLARLELGIALREWHRRKPQYRLPQNYVVRFTPGLRGVENLILEFPA
jgi:cytochrome P450